MLYFILFVIWWVGLFAWVWLPLIAVAILAWAVSRLRETWSPRARNIFAGSVAALCTALAAGMALVLCFYNPMRCLTGAQRLKITIDDNGRRSRCRRRL